MINRDEMIVHIATKWASWSDFHDYIIGDTSIDIIRKVDGWFISFEGCEPSDMYLGSKDPRGYDHGEIITCSDCFKI